MAFPPMATILGVQSFCACTFIWHYTSYYAQVAAHHPNSSVMHQFTNFCNNALSCHLVGTLMLQWLPPLVKGENKQTIKCATQVTMHCPVISVSLHHHYNHSSNFWWHKYTRCNKCENPFNRIHATQETWKWYIPWQKILCGPRTTSVACRRGLWMI